MTSNPPVPSQSALRSSQGPHTSLPVAYRLPPIDEIIRDEFRPICGERLISANEDSVQASTTTVFQGAQFQGTQQKHGGISIFTCPNVHTASGICSAQRCYISGSRRNQRICRQSRLIGHWYPKSHLSAIVSDPASSHLSNHSAGTQSLRSYRMTARYLPPPVRAYSTYSQSIVPAGCLSHKSDQNYVDSFFPSCGQRGQPQYSAKSGRAFSTSVALTPRAYSHSSEEVYRRRCIGCKTLFSSCSNRTPQEGKYTACKPCYCTMMSGMCSRACQKHSFLRQLQAPGPSISTTNAASQQNSQDTQRSVTFPYHQGLHLVTPDKNARSPSLKQALISMPDQNAAIRESHSACARSIIPGSSLSDNQLERIVLGRSQNRGPDISGSTNLIPAHNGSPVINKLCSLSPKNGAIMASMPKGAVTENDKDLDMVDGKGRVSSFPRFSPLPQDTLERTKASIHTLFPLLPSAQIDRFAQAQLFQLDRLLRLRWEHSVAVANQSCKAGKLCSALGGDAAVSQERKTPADKEVDSFYMLGAKGFIAARLPPSMPRPPVHRLPAKFECPICFEVVKFQKVSDWTIHVYADVRTFICHFSECNETTTFKRRPDWVRHQEEIHVRLSRWVCFYPECEYTTSRKKHLVRHLMRDHERLEPKTNDLSVLDASPDSMREEELMQKVEDCRCETDQFPQQMQCLFCEETCEGQKIFMKHMGDHMQQLAELLFKSVENHE